jgi:hypothetical protein
MRWIILASVLGLSACAAAHDVAAVDNWKKEARAKCAAETDLIRREQCVQQVETVSLERMRTEVERPRR